MGGLEHYLKTGMGDEEELCAWAEGIDITEQENDEYV